MTLDALIDNRDYMLRAARVHANNNRTATDANAVPPSSPALSHIPVPPSHTLQLKAEVFRAVGDLKGFLFGNNAKS